MGGQVTNGAADVQRLPSWFEPKITLGSALQTVMLIALLIAAWVHISDRVSALEDFRAQQQVLYQKELDLTQQMQLAQAQETIVIQNLERRVAIVEDKNGLGDPKK